VQQIGLLQQLDHLAGFRHIPGERLFARDSDQLTNAAFERVDDLLHVLHTPMVRTTDPQAINGRVSNHVRDGCIGLGLTHVQASGIRRSFLGIVLIGAPDAEHIGVSDRLPGQDVEFGDESASYEADSQTGFLWHGSRMIFDFLMAEDSNAGHRCTGKSDALASHSSCRSDSEIR